MLDSAIKLRAEVLFTKHHGHSARASIHILLSLFLFYFSFGSASENNIRTVTFFVVLTTRSLTTLVYEVVQQRIRKQACAKHTTRAGHALSMHACNDKFSGNGCTSSVRFMVPYRHRYAAAGNAFPVRSATWSL